MNNQSIELLIFQPGKRQIKNQIYATSINKRSFSVSYPAYPIWYERVTIYEKIRIGNQRLGFVPKRDGEKLGLNCYFRPYHSSAAFPVIPRYMAESTMMTPIQLTTDVSL